MLEHERTLVDTLLESTPVDLLWRAIAQLGTEPTEIVERLDAKRDAASVPSIAEAARQIAILGEKAEEAQRSGGADAVAAAMRMLLVEEQYDEASPERIEYATAQMWTAFHPPDAKHQPRLAAGRKVKGRHVGYLKGVHSLMVANAVNTLHLPERLPASGRDDWLALAPLRESGTLAALFHDIKEDTREEPEILTSSTVSKYPYLAAGFPDQVAGLKVYDLVTGAIRYLTRRDAFYPFEFRQMLEQEPDTAISRSLAAIVKSGCDRSWGNLYRNYGARKNLKEDAKSMVVAEVARRLRLRMERDDPLYEPMAIAEYRNLLTLYSELRRHNQETRAQLTPGAREDVEDAVKAHIREDGLSTRSRRISGTNYTQPESLHGIMQGLATLMVPRVREIRRIAIERGDEYERYVGMMLDNASSFTLTQPCRPGKEREALREVYRMQRSVRDRLAQPGGAYQHGLALEMLTLTYIFNPQHTLFDWNGAKR